jgi:hypothetical protein
LGGMAASAFAASGANTYTGTQTLPANGLVVGGTELVTSGGNVGIGTATPGRALDVVTASTMEAGRFTANNAAAVVNIAQNGAGNGLIASTATTTGGVAVLGAGTGTAGTGYSIGVEGTGVGASSYGVVGSAVNVGVEGETSAGGGIGVLGVNFNTSSFPSVGVQGSTSSPTGVAGEFLKQTGTISAFPALLAANGGTGGEAAWFGLTNASNPYDVLKLVLPSGSKSNFLEGDLPNGIPVFIVDAKGNISNFGGSIITAAGTGTAMNIVAGSGNSLSIPGGPVSVTAGNGGPLGGGNIVLTPGTGSPAGTVLTSSRIRMGAESGTSEPPTVSATPGYLGLVLRRINSASTTAGSIVAKTDTMTLERDGTAGGFQIAVAAAAGNFSIACLGLTSTTTVVGFTDSFANPSATTLEIFSASDVTQFNCSFGNTGEGHVTEVNLLRFPGGSTWVGTVTSTFNQ